MFGNANIRNLYALGAVSLVILVGFHPGFMSFDSVDQLGMAISRDFSDWHPPIMSWIWSIVTSFLPGPSGMLLLQVSLLMAALYLWCGRYKSSKFSWVIVVVPLFPWIINFSGVIWKDVGLAFALLALAGLGLHRPTAAKIILATFISFYAVNIRYNAVIAVAPIIFLLAYQWMPRATVIKASTSTIIAVLALVAFGSVFNYQILEARKTHPEKFIMIDDLSYLSIVNNESFVLGVGLEEIKDCAVAELGKNRLVGRVFCLMSKSEFNVEQISVSELRSAWISKITDDPIEYLKFRFAALSYLLRSAYDAPYYIWHPGVDQNKFDIEHTPNYVSIGIEEFAKASADGLPFLFKPYWWLALSVLVFVFSFLLKDTVTNFVARVLIFSAVIYIAGYFPSTQMADFRYVYWSVVAISMAVLALILDWPGFRAGLSKKRVCSVVTIVAVSCLLIVNHSRLFELNVDQLIYNSIEGEKVAAGSPEVTSDLVYAGGGYEVTGVDPFLVYMIPSDGLAPRDVKWLKFDFTCSGMHARPELQLFWWGDDQPGPSEQQSKFRQLAEGVNLLPLGSYLDGTGISVMRGVRVDLANSDACDKITVAEMEIILEPVK